MTVRLEDQEDELFFLEGKEELEQEQDCECVIVVFRCCFISCFYY